MYRLQRNLLPFAFLFLVGCESPSEDSPIKDEVAEENNTEWETDSIIPGYNEDDSESEENPGVGGGDGTGEGQSPYSVLQLITLGEGELNNVVYVRGYVVGSANRSAVSNADFGTEKAVATNLLIADSPSEKDYKRCISVGLETGVIRDAMNLVDNPERLGQKITVCGSVGNYLYILGIPKPLMIENQD